MWTEVYAGKVINSLAIYTLPKIDAKSISGIKAPQMLEILRAIEALGVNETAKRMMQRSRAVFQHGIKTGRCSRNPVPTSTSKPWATTGNHYPENSLRRRGVEQFDMENRR